MLLYKFLYIRNYSQSLFYVPLELDARYFIPYHEWSLRNFIKTCLKSMLVSPSPEKCYIRKIMDNSMVVLLISPWLALHTWEHRIYKPSWKATIMDASKNWFSVLLSIDFYDIQKYQKYWSSFLDSQGKKETLKLYHNFTWTDLT